MKHKYICSVCGTYYVCRKCAAYRAARKAERKARGSAPLTYRPFENLKDLLKQ